jgi:hypothetical protein
VSHAHFLVGEGLVTTLGADGFCLRDATTLEVRHHLPMPRDDLDLRIWPSLHVDPRRPRAYVVAATGEVLALDADGPAPVEEGFDEVLEVSDLAFAAGAPRAAIRPRESTEVLVADLEAARWVQVDLPTIHDRAPYALDASGEAVWVLTGATATRVPVPPLP